MLISKPPPYTRDYDKARHPSWRRYTAKYRRKKRIVRDVWLLSTALMLCVPVMALPVIIMGTTFLAFMILDETP